VHRESVRQCTEQVWRGRNTLEKKMGAAAAATTPECSCLEDLP